MSDNSSELQKKLEELQKEYDTTFLRLRDVTKERDLLKSRIEEYSFEERVRELMELLNTTMTVAEPEGYIYLIKSTLRTIRKLLNAEWSSILLVDKKTKELVLETDPDREKPMVFRFPVGEGIAGAVAVTGEPVIAADIQSDPRWKKDIAEATGYHPMSILCVPLIYNEDIIGVVEAFDKINNEPFTIEDMNLLTTMSDLLATLVYNMSIYRDISFLFLATLKQISSQATMELKGKDLTEKITEYAAELSKKMELGEAYQETLHLAKLVHEIGEHGPHSRELCKKFLTYFLEYIHNVEGENKLWTF
ncbi:MAG: GAF domain-containing protein [Candidatus Eremiobacterota bacterium]